MVGFNNSQIAVFFLMLSHYVCDAHVPVHCDNRDFYKPSKVHPDLEEFWEKQILKFFPISENKEQFDLDADGNLQRDRDVSGYKESILYACDQLTENSRWKDMSEASQNWRVFLGKKNNNFWDYMVAICVVSFHMSQKMFPPDMHIAGEAVDYDRVRIMKTEPFRDHVIRFSPYILADAINSVALLWLAAWERWELLSEGKR